MLAHIKKKKLKTNVSIIERVVCFNFVIETGKKKKRYLEPVSE